MEHLNVGIRAAMNQLLENCEHAYALVQPGAQVNSSRQGVCYGQLVKRVLFDLFVSALIFFT